MPGVKSDAAGHQLIFKMSSEDQTVDDTNKLTENDDDTILVRHTHTHTHTKPPNHQIHNRRGQRIVRMGRYPTVYLGLDPKNTDLLPRWD